MRMILADMMVKTNIADMILEKAVDAIDEKPNHWQRQAHAATVHIHKMACDLTADGIQILGGIGYMKDHPQEKRFRDAQSARSLMGSYAMSKLKLIPKNL